MAVHHVLVPSLSTEKIKASDTLLSLVAVTWTETVGEKDKTEPDSAGNNIPDLLVRPILLPIFHRAVISVLLSMVARSGIIRRLFLVISNPPLI